MIEFACFRYASCNVLAVIGTDGNNKQPSRMPLLVMPLAASEPAGKMEDTTSSWCTAAHLEMLAC